MEEKGGELFRLQQKLYSYSCKTRERGREKERKESEREQREGEKGNKGRKVQLASAVKLE